MEKFLCDISEAIERERFDRALTRALLLPELLTRSVDAVSSSYERNTQFFEEFMPHVANMRPSDFFALQEVYVDKGITDLSQSSRSGNLRMVVFIPGTAMHYTLASGIVLIVCIQPFIKEIVDGCMSLWRRMSPQQRIDASELMDEASRVIDGQSTLVRKFFDIVDFKIPLMPGILALDVSKLMKRQKKVWF